MTTDERDVLQYAARSLDEIREHLEQAPIGDGASAGIRQVGAGA